MRLGTSDKHDESRPRTLRERCDSLFGGDELSIPAESIAEGLSLAGEPWTG